MSEFEKQSAQIADHFFRHESSKLRAALTNVLGTQYLDLCDDIIQEAIYRALSRWSVGGLPPDPAGWIFKTARNIAIDYIRRDKLFQGKSQEIMYHLNQLDISGPYRETQLEDSLFRMIFACCHPDLSRETQLILTLKILCSFHNKEIASALLKKESAIEKAVSRGKQKMRNLVDLETLDSETDLEERLDHVLHAIYLVFNEGYKASTGDVLIKESLVLESIRLVRILLSNPKTNHPKVNALLSLLLFTSARFNTRVTEDGELLLLKYQKRSEWNQNLIAEGQHYLNQSSTGNSISQYHLLAGIAACHAFAPSFESTDWNLILDQYDLLVEQDHSPVFVLNRIVALLYAKGAKSAHEALKVLDQEKVISNYYLYYMVYAEVMNELNEKGDAIKYLAKAIELTENSIEKRYIRLRMEQI